MKFFYLKYYQVEELLGNTETSALNQTAVINPRELNIRFQGGMFRELGFAWVTLYTVLVQHFPLYLDH